MLINFFYFNKYSVLKVFFFTIVLFFFLTEAFFVQTEKNNILAEVGSKKITTNDFKFFLIENLQSCARIDTLSSGSMKVYLDSLINSTLILSEAENEKLDNDPAIKNKINNFSDEVISDRLIENQVIDSIITKKRLKDFYQEFGGELHLKQILIRNSSKTYADSIYSEIKNGLDFSSAAKKFSQDAATAKKGGDAGFVRWGQLIEQVQDAAFNLKSKEVSQPIKTPFGYYIIQVVSKTKCGFDTEYRNLKYQMAAVYARTIKYNKEIYLTGLEKKYGVKLIETNIKKIIDHIGSSYAPFESVPENLSKIPLVVYQNQSINLKDLINKVGSDNITNYNWNEKTFTKWLSSLAMNRISILEAKSLGLNADKDIERYKNHKLISLMKGNALQVEVSNKELKNYYTKNKNDFRFPERVRIKYVVVAEEFIAKNIFNKAKEGKNFDKLVKDYTIDAKSLTTNGDIGFIARSQYREIFDAVVNLKVGEIAGPISIPQGFAVVKLIDKEKPRIKTFEEAKNQIEAILQKRKKERAYANFISKLKKKYEVKINHKIFSEYIKDPLSYNYSTNSNLNNVTKSYAKTSY